MTTPPYNKDQVLLRAFIPEQDAIRVYKDGILAGVKCDAILGYQPSATVRVFEYRLGGVAGAVQATITVTYVDSTRQDIVSVVRS